MNEHIELNEEMSLSSVYDIEELLLSIGTMNHQIEYYKELKKHRVNSIDVEIGGLTSKIDVLRKVILNTMKNVAPDEKTLNFPSIAKITRRKSKSRIAVDDQDQVIDFLDEAGLKEQIVDVRESINKIKLMKLVNEYRETGQAIPGTSVVPSDESLSITYDKSPSTNETSTQSTDVETLDALQI